MQKSLSPSSSHPPVKRTNSIAPLSYLQEESLAEQPVDEDMNHAEALVDHGDDRDVGGVRTDADLLWEGGR